MREEITDCLGRSKRVRGGGNVSISCKEDSGGKIMIHRILSLGTIAVDTMLYIDKMPGKDGFGHVYSEKVVPGGSSANVAVAVKELGNIVLQSGKIADDSFGVIIKNNLKEEGIDTRYLVTEPGGESLHTYIVVDKSGEHFILANSGNCVMNLEKEEIPDQLFEDIDLFYTDLASPRAAVYIAGECYRRGIPVVYNLQNPPSMDQGVTSEVIDEMLEYTSLFITGKATICATTGIDDSVQAVKTFIGEHHLPDGFICTQGSAGADWFTEEEYHCGICEVDSVDTTGAGDVYIAGIMDSYYCKQKSKQESMKDAAVVAALKTMQTGPRFSMDREKLEEMRTMYIS